MITKHQQRLLIFVFNTTTLVFSLQYILNFIIMYVCASLFTVYLLTIQAKKDATKQGWLEIVKIVLYRVNIKRKQLSNYSNRAANLKKKGVFNSLKVHAIWWQEIYNFVI